MFKSDMELFNELKGFPWPFIGNWNREIRLLRLRHIRLLHFLRQILHFRHSLRQIRQTRRIRQIHLFLRHRFRQILLK